MTPVPTLQDSAPEATAAKHKSNVLADLSLFFGILCLIPGVGIVACVPAIAFGRLGIRRARAHPGRGANRYAAVGGVVLGYVTLCAYLLTLVVLWVGGQHP